MKRSARRAGRLLRSLGRLLLGRNELRRPIDRVEGAVIVSLVAAFLAATVAAAGLAGHFYQSQRAAAVRLRPAMAVLSQPGPVATSTMVVAAARWRPPHGAERSGTLTTMTAPAISGAPAGTKVQVWLDRTGQPQAPPPSPAGMIVTAVVAGMAVAAAAALALALCYVLCRALLDRRRFTRWESAWATIGPRWISRR
jgi:multisubunit Na+/H+ antiporter MnhC subunit